MSKDPVEGMALELVDWAMNKFAAEAWADVVRLQIKTRLLEAKAMARLKAKQK